MHREAEQGKKAQVFFLEASPASRVLSVVVGKPRANVRQPGR